MPVRIVVIAHAASYAAPIAGRAGDRVRVGREDPDGAGWFWCRHAASGREGWVAGAFLVRDASRPTLRWDYDAAELDITAGEAVEAGEDVAGWTWCAASSGRAGWVPTPKLGPAG